MKILITGASGFIGRHLVQNLASNGHELVLFSHYTSPPSGHPTIHSLDELSGTHEDFDAVINLAGAPIMGRPWTSARKDVLWKSRVSFTQALVASLGQMKKPPGIFLSGSAIGIYGDHAAERLDESSATGGGFGHTLCAAWESAALDARHFGARTALLRTGLVIGSGGGFLEPMARSFRLGLGGPIGDGQQWMSWIHIDDHIRLMRHLLDQNHAEGIYNLTAPQPVTNAVFTETLAQVLRRPAFLRMPAKFLKILLGEMAGLLLESQRVIPERAIKEGFSFSYSELEPALKNALRGS
jgi:uncharacterized protein